MALYVPWRVASSKLPGLLGRGWGGWGAWGASAGLLTVLFAWQIVFSWGGWILDVAETWQVATEGLLSIVGSEPACQKSLRGLQNYWLDRHQKWTWRSFYNICFPSFSETLKHCQQSCGCGPEERHLVLRLDPDSSYFMFRATLVPIA